MCLLHLSFHSQALIKASFEGLEELKMSARLLVTRPQPMTPNSNAYEQLHRVEGAMVTGLVLEPFGWRTLLQRGSPLPQPSHWSQLVQDGHCHVSLLHSVFIIDPGTAGPNPVYSHFFLKSDSNAAQHTAKVSTHPAAPAHGLSWDGLAGG